MELGEVWIIGMGSICFDVLFDEGLSGIWDENKRVDGIVINCVDRDKR